MAKTQIWEHERQKMFYYDEVRSYNLEFKTELHPIMNRSLQKKSNDNHDIYSVDC